MKKKLFFGVSVWGVVLLLSASAWAYEAFKGPVGVLQNGPGTTDGYMLIVPYNGKVSYLIDNSGNIINQWKSEYKGFYGEMLPNGHMVRHAMITDAKPNTFGGTCGVLEEFDWNGKKVWEYKMYVPEKMVSHHTFEVMPNGNYLLLGWECKSYEDAVTKGMDPKAAGMLPGLGGRTLSPDGLTVPKNLDDKEETVKGIWPDFIREVDHDGKTVWEWHVWDHIGPGKDQININVFLPPYFSKTYAGPDWTHFNGLAYNPKTDEICVTSRNLGEVLIISKSTGKITSRWGNPANYGEGRAPGGYSDDGDQKLFGPHAPDWTPEGTITILDNGNNRPSGNYTAAVELDPKTGKVVWEWGPKSVKAAGSNFYSAFQCGAQKLPNGNWVITTTTDGHVIEVTRDKKIVWEFVCPVDADGKIFKTSGPHGSGMGIHKALRYAVDYPGFAGKDMGPRGQMPNWTETFGTEAFPLKPMPDPAEPVPATSKP